MSPKSHDRNLRNKTLAVIAGTVVVIAGSTIGYRQVTDGGGGEPGTANFWVDTNGGSCVRNTSPAAYNDANACSSLNTAYQSTSNGGTQCGDIINIKGGTYGNQTLTERASLSGCSSDVEFWVADGETMTTGWISFASVNIFANDGVDHVQFHGPATLTGITCAGDCTWITIDNVQGGTVQILGDATLRPQNWTIQNSDWGPCESGSGNQSSCENPLPYTNQFYVDGVDDISIIGNEIHGYDTVPNNCSDCDHFECIIGSGSDFYIARNKMYACEIYGINLGGGVTGTNYIENNWLGASDWAAGPSEPNGKILTLAPGSLMTGTFYIRFNSFSTLDGPSADLVTGGHAGYIFVGNVIGNTQCLSGATYQYNVFENGSCGDGTNQGSVTLNYVNGDRYSSMNYHLNGSNWAPDNKVPCGSVTGGCPATDWDGESRPVNSNADAGSDERNQ